MKIKKFDELNENQIVKDNKIIIKGTYKSKIIKDGYIEIIFEDDFDRLYFENKNGKFLTNLQFLEDDDGNIIDVIAEIN